MKCSEVIGWLQVALYLGFCRCACFRYCCGRNPKQSRQRIQLKPLLLGLSKSGKTTFVKNLLKLTQQQHKTNDTSSSSQAFPRIVDNDHEYVPTGGCVTHKEFWYRDFKLTFFEVGGGFIKYWTKYTTGCHGLIYLVCGDLKESIDALETFAVGNDAVRDWPVCILWSRAAEDHGDEKVKELEKYLRTRHLLKAWVNNMYVAKTSSCSSSAYSTTIAEEDVRKALDFVCVGACEYKFKQQ